MKISDSNKPVYTTPKGVWEGSHPIDKKRKKNNHTFSASTDLQGNGYPSNKQSK